VAKPSSLSCVSDEPTRARRRGHRRLSLVSSPLPLPFHKLKLSPPPPSPQRNLNRRRYAINQEDLYLAPADARTDYSQPPMGGYFSGVLNTGRRRYVHPALAGVLPSPWYPRAAEESLESQATTGMETSTPSSTQADLEAGTSARADSRKGMAVVLSLRRKVVRLARKAVGNDAAAQDEETPLLQDEPAALISPAVAGAASSDGARNPWSDTAGGRSGESYRDEPTKTTVGRAGTTSARMGPGLSKRLSFDPTTVRALTLSFLFPMLSASQPLLHRASSFSPTQTTMTMSRRRTTSPQALGLLLRRGRNMIELRGNSRYAFIQPRSLTHLTFG
jgi:hypothetical protein